VALRRAGPAVPTNLILQSYRTAEDVDFEDGVQSPRKPEKNWKFSVADVREREHWNEYMRYYEEMIRGTATPQAPWYVVPADHKWFTRLVVADAIVETLEDLDPCFPPIDEEKRKELEEARAMMEGKVPS
jgi:Polyphosphate kinase 2 (PPK2)